MLESQITERGQITIPQDVRNDLGIQPGDLFSFSIVKKGVLIRKKTNKSVFEKYRGYLKRSKIKDVDKYVEEMRGR